MQKNLLTKQECSALRGLAIIGIFLHNYCHWLGPAVKENEYQFFRMNVDGLNRALLHPDGLLPVHLISFFGHYGVPIFLFLSAYGLTMKYENAAQTGRPEPSPWRFTRYHFLKLFKMMIVGFVAFTMVDNVLPHPHEYHFLDVVAQLGLFNNVLPHPDDVIWPGPYWFFGLMLQLYIVYRLLLYRRHWGYTVGLIVLCTAIQLMCDPEGEALNRWRYNFIGGILPFGAGLLFARYGSMPSRQKLVVVVLLAVLGTYAFSQNYVLWYLVPLLVVFGSVALVRLLPAKCLSLFDKVGVISAALFVCHPITRRLFIPISHRDYIYTGLLLYVVASLCMAWAFYKLLKYIPNPKMSKHS